ncbi:MAG: hypothetical protein HKN52_10650 [Eudoraea sp.]|nr:hypothetical protein [Eudoraea sp.]
MKTTKLLLILMAVMSLMACKQKQNGTMQENLPDSSDPTVHIVTLYVKTNEISVDTAEINLKPGLDDYAYFEKDQDTPNIDHTIHVKKGDIIIWRGIPENDTEDIVNISSINFRGGKGLTNIFKQNRLPGNGEVPEMVVATVIEGPDSTEGSEDNKKPLTYKYMLDFKVMDDGMPRNGTYHIDPKIQVH